jgi:N-acetylglucosaminyldiphosphoundecaprenol N-acetyl-beta-D-mannosaminyltransferase
LENSSKLAYIFTPNPEQIIESRQNSTFLKALQQATWLLPDGIGLVWASQLLAQKKKIRPLTQRITGVEMVEELLKVAREERRRVLIIGGFYDGQYHAGIQAIFEKTWDCVMTPGYADISQPTPQEEENVALVIKKVKPELVFVAFGAPHQELWVVNHHDLLEKNGAKLAMVVGGSFDFIFGKVRRAPVWVQRLSLEWLYRLIRQPWRWRRQLRLIQFIWLTIQEFLR